ncbi:MAG: ABC transporter ATP-binding protein [SAR202 cluster bacterium]|nr:ABC transporter ATP-binding protein [SAR202 cluster bacterium]
MSAPLIEAHGLSKRYGAFTAVDHIDMRLDEGEVFGFLGPNGSGKSTTILMLLGLTEPSEGDVTVLGHNPTRDPMAVKRQVGYLPETVGFYPDLTGKQNLEYTAALNRIPRADADRRIKELLEMVELGHAIDQPVGQYSRGMRQRLGFADVLLKQPKLVILDDPTLGLDPTGIQWLLGLIEEMSKNQAITILLSSHALQEVQRVCDRVAIMSHGKIVLQGTVTSLTAGDGTTGYHIAVEVRSAKPGLVEAARELPGVTSADLSGNLLTVHAERDVRPQLISSLIANGGELLEVRARNRSLEDIYLRYFQEGALA